MLLSTADKHRGSLTHYPTHRGPANRSPYYVPLRAVYPIFRFFLTPFVYFKWFWDLKKCKAKRVYRDLYCMFLPFDQ